MKVKIVVAIDGQRQTLTHFIFALYIRIKLYV